MSPNMTDPVEAALAHLYRSTTAAAVAPEVGAIVGRARRRRTTRLVAAGIVALVAVGVVVALGGSPRAIRSVPPAEPSISRVDPGERIPSGFLETPMLGPAGAVIQGGSDLVDYWYESRDRDAVPIGECGTSLVDVLGVERHTATNSLVHIDLKLFRDDGAAHTAFVCAKFADLDLLPQQWPSYGDESRAVSYRQERDGAGEFTGQPVHHVAVRVGRTILTVQSGSSTLDTGPVLAASPELVDAVVSTILPRLCLWTSDGCRPADGLPAPLAALTPDGRPWLLLLHGYPTGSDPLEDLTIARDGGRAIAAMAELGYHPVIVPTGCDLSPELHPNVKEYLALYFAQRDEAEAVWARLALRSDTLFPDKLVVQVRARCLH